MGLFGRNSSCTKQIGTKCKCSPFDFRSMRIHFTRCFLKIIVKSRIYTDHTERSKARHDQIVVGVSQWYINIVIQISQRICWENKDRGNARNVINCKLDVEMQAWCGIFLSLCRNTRLTNITGRALVCRLNWKLRHVRWISWTRRPIRQLPATILRTSKASLVRCATMCAVGDPVISFHFYFFCRRYSRLWAGHRYLRQFYAFAFIQSVESSWDRAEYYAGCLIVHEHWCQSRS